MAIRSRSTSLRLASQRNDRDRIVRVIAERSGFGAAAALAIPALVVPHCQEPGVGQRSCKLSENRDTGNHAISIVGAGPGEQDDDGHAVGRGSGPRERRAQIESSGRNVYGLVSGVRVHQGASGGRSKVLAYHIQALGWDVDAEERMVLVGEEIQDARAAGIGERQDVAPHIEHGRADLHTLGAHTRQAKGALPSGAEECSKFLIGRGTCQAARQRLVGTKEDVGKNDYPSRHVSGLCDSLSTIHAPGHRRLAAEGRLQHRIAAVDGRFNLECLWRPVGPIAHLGTPHHDVERSGQPAFARDGDPVGCYFNGDVLAANHRAAHKHRVAVGDGRGFAVRAAVSQPRELRKAAPPPRYNSQQARLGSYQVFPSYDLR